MEKVAKLFSLIIILNLLSGCDSLSFFVIKNNTDESLETRFVFKEGQSVYPIRDTLYVDSKEKGVKVYGFGHRWSNRTVIDFSQSLDSLYIINQKDTLVCLVEQEDIYSFIQKKRKGITNNRIKVTINSKGKPD